MDIKIDKKLITRLLTILPPLLGVVLFTYIIKYSGIKAVPLRIPLFQGLSAYFSLILLGFTYIKNRQNVIGYKIVIILFLIMLFPILFYVYNGLKLDITVIFVVLQFFASIILYLTIVRGKMIQYLLFACVNSIVMPLSLALNEIALVILCFCLIIIFIYLFLYNRHKFGHFNFEDSGLNVIKSIFFQSPLIILPFFDFKIAEIIGRESYSNYVLYYKYINGIIVLLFSYKQLNLTFSGELSKKKRIIFELIFILFALFFCILLGNIYSLLISIALYSIGVNLCSLLIRNALLSGVPFYYTLIGFFSTIIYSITIFNCGSFISLSNSLFIVLMFISTLIPALFNYFKSREISDMS